MGSINRYGLLADALEDAAQEAFSALSAHGGFHSLHEGFSVMKEEVDELWEVVREKESSPGRRARCYDEAKQVAAMALRIMVEFGLKGA